jgi:hypothetical protein
MPGRERRHGIYITEGACWNTKTVYDRGRVVEVYDRVPKMIRFRSPMVNDFNQPLETCWPTSDIPDINEAIVQQLLQGKKPLGEAYFDDEAQAADASQRLRDAGLLVNWRRCGSGDHVRHDVEACHDLRLRDLGSFQDLRADYTSAGLPLRSEKYHAGRTLESYWGGKWNSERTPQWVTGLVLGYPVENTISLIWKLTLDNDPEAEVLFPHWRKVNAPDQDAPAVIED